MLFLPREVAIKWIENRWFDRMRDLDERLYEDLRRAHDAIADAHFRFEKDKFTALREFEEELADLKEGC